MWIALGSENEKENAKIFVRWKSVDLLWATVCQILRESDRNSRWFSDFLFEFCLGRRLDALGWNSGKNLLFEFFAQTYFKSTHIEYILKSFIFSLLRPSTCPQWEIGWLKVQEVILLNCVFLFFIRWSIPQLRKSHNMKPLVGTHFPGTGLQSEILRENLSLLLSPNMEKVMFSRKNWPSSFWLF